MHYPPWIKQNRRWLTLALIVPFISAGVLHRFHGPWPYYADTSEVETAPLRMLSFGCLALIPSIIGVVTALVLMQRLSFFHRLILNFNWPGRFLIESFVYALYMALTVGMIVSSDHAHHNHQWHTFSTTGLIHEAVGFSIAGILWNWIATLICGSILAKLFKK